MRICSPQVGLDPASHLGGAVHDWEILRAVARRGVEVHILLPRGARCSHQPGWTIHRTSIHRLSFYEYNLIFRRFLLTCGRDLNLDLLRVHSPYAVGPGVIAAGRRLGCPVVAHYHHLEDRVVDHLINRWTIRRYHALITVSRFSREQIAQRYRVERSKIYVVPNGVDTERFRPLGSDTGEGLPALHPRARVLAFVGALIPRKNVKILPEILARLLPRHPELHLLIAGQGPEGRTIKERGGQYGVGDRVHLLGPISEEQKIGLMRRAEVFLFPSHLEGFGLAAAEAMACGTPVVAARSGGLPEVVEEGVTGFLCDPGAVEAFARAVDLLLRDPVLAKKMGEAARRRIRERFGWESAASRLVEIYERTAHEARRAG